MVRVGIDARLLTQTGVGVYTYNLLLFLTQYAPKNWQIVLYVRKDDVAHLPIGNWEIHIANHRWHTFSEQTFFYLQLMRDKLDLMHFTYFSYPILYRRPFISTIHDVTPILFKTGKVSTKSLLEYYPKYYVMRDVIKKAVYNARAVITPTEAVKKQMVTLYGQSVASKIHPIHEGINNKIFSLKPNQTLAKKFNEPFFLYIGNFYPHKNIERLINAFSKVQTDHSLILVGPKDYFSRRISQLIETTGLTNKVRLYYNPKLEDIVFFYQHAKASIHPSLSEGFGLTTLEAAYFGCPIIASNIPVFKEILGNGYIAFNPEKESDIEKKITQSLSGSLPKISKKLIEGYSFENMTKQTVELYKKVISM